MKGLAPWMKWWLKEKEKVEPVWFPETPAEPWHDHLPYLDELWLLVPWVCWRKRLIGSLETGFLVGLRQTHTKISANWCDLLCWPVSLTFFSAYLQPLRLNPSAGGKWTAVSYTAELDRPPQPKSVSNTTKTSCQHIFLQYLDPNVLHLLYYMSSYKNNFYLYQLLSLF